MATQNKSVVGRASAVGELRRLPPERRDALLEAAAQLAASEYELDSELTGFEAFGKDDLYGHSSTSEAR
jgi:hypothetical protein